MKRKGWSAASRVVILAATVKAAASAVAYLERSSVEPYLDGPEVMYWRGHLQQTGAGGAAINFTDFAPMASRWDVVLAVLRSDDDFELKPLDDCWGLGHQEEQCCAGTAGDPSCFGGAFTFDRCCRAAQAGRVFLDESMAEARLQASPLLLRYRIDEGNFERRRLRYRVGRHPEDCKLRVPWEPLPKSIAALRIGETGLRAAFNVLRDAGRATRKALQVGVNDGRSDDPLYHLVTLEEFSGVGLEADPVLVNKSRQNRPGRFNTFHAFATPHNIWAYAGPVGEMDIVSVDIDSFDCHLVESLLDHAIARQARTGVPLPALLQIETNTMIPPPFLFVRRYAPHVTLPGFTVHQQLATTSCSLSYALTSFRRRGYELLFFGYDSIFVRKDLLPLYAEAWGHKFPKDEFECYRQATVHSCGAPMRHVREWFFNSDDPHDLKVTRQRIASNLSNLCNVDRLSCDAARLSTVEGLEDVLRMRELGHEALIKLGQMFE